MTALIAGNSHVACMVQALRDHTRHPRSGFKAHRIRPRHWSIDGTEVIFTGVDHRNLHSQSFVAVENEGFRFVDAAATRMIKRWTGSNVIPLRSPFGVCVVSNTARKLLRDPAWQRFAPSRWAGPNVQPITDDVLWSALSNDQCDARKLFQLLRNYGANVFAIAGPPVRANHPQSRYGLAPDAIRHIDAMSREIWKDWLANMEIPLVEPPECTVGSDGFMLPEYENHRAGAEPDRHHANLDYGALMATKVAHQASLLNYPTGDL